MAPPVEAGHLLVHCPIVLDIRRRDRQHARWRLFGLLPLGDFPHQLVELIVVHAVGKDAEHVAVALGVLPPKPLQMLLQRGLDLGLAEQALDDDVLFGLGVVLGWCLSSKKSSLSKATWSSAVLASSRRAKSCGAGEGRATNEKTRSSCIRRTGRCWTLRCHPLE
jgi:hypothetical protein